MVDPRHQAWQWNKLDFAKRRRKPTSRGDPVPGGDPWGATWAGWIWHLGAAAAVTGYDNRATSSMVKPDGPTPLLDDCGSDQGWICETTRWILMLLVYCRLSPLVISLGMLVIILVIHHLSVPEPKMLVHGACNDACGIWWSKLPPEAIH